MPPPCVRVQSGDQRLACTAQACSSDTDSGSELEDLLASLPVATGASELDVHSNVHNASTDAATASDARDATVDWHSSEQGVYCRAIERALSTAASIASCGAAGASLHWWDSVVHEVEDLWRHAHSESSDAPNRAQTRLAALCQAAGHCVRCATWQQPAGLGSAAQELRHSRLSSSLQDLHNLLQGWLQHCGASNGHQTAHPSVLPGASQSDCSVVQCAKALPLRCQFAS
jgi:hypothetical protein